LILKRIEEIQIQLKVDLMGKSQHGFIKPRSTAKKYCLMSSLDLSAAFDVVNINQLLKRLEIFALPSDIITLNKIWLK
jgi:hypothetical protein